MKITTFKVTGYGHFPFDMLRHDSCWPADPGSVGRLDALYERTIILRTHGEVTIERWRSFLWSPHDIEKQKS